MPRLTLLLRHSYQVILSDKVHLRVLNCTEDEIVLPAGKVIAVCAAVQQVEDIMPPTPHEKEFGSYIEEWCRKLPAQEQSKARQILHGHRQVLSQGKYDLGRAKATHHDIPLTQGLDH